MVADSLHHGRSSLRACVEGFFHLDFATVAESREVMTAQETGNLRRAAVISASPRLSYPCFHTASAPKPGDQAPPAAPPRAPCLVSCPAMYLLSPYILFPPLQPTPRSQLCQLLLPHLLPPLPASSVRGLHGC